MVNSNKILTVSYGTFSCTLEGFEDSFGTMKAIAEYFRDLAADDRFFGAEPPQPDAEMMAVIAQREAARPVQARRDETGIVLRAADATPTGTPNVDAGSGAGAGAGAVAIPAAAAAFSRISADEPVEDAVTEPARDTVIDADTNLKSDTPAPSDKINSGDTADVEILPERTPDTPPDTHNVPAEPVQSEDISAKLDRIRAVVAQNDTLSIEDDSDTAVDVAEDLIKDLKSTADTEDTLQDTDSLSVDAMLDRLEDEADVEGDSLFDETQDDASEDNSLFADISGDDTTIDEIPDEGPAPDEQIADTPDTAADTAPKVLVKKMKQSDIEDAIAAGLLEEVEDEDARDDDEAIEVIVDAEGEEPAAQIRAAVENSSLSDEDEEDLIRELAAVEAEFVQVDQDDALLAEDDTPDAEDIIDAAFFDVEDDAIDMPLDQADDADVSRLMDAAEAKLDDPEASSNSEAYSHLRAAVAATEADREAGADPDQGSPDELFREDLAQAVKPRRPERRARGNDDVTEPRKAAPLKLVAAQRIDEAPVSTGTVRPRRVVAQVELAETSEDNSGFLEYVASHDATNLEEHLEAAASYMTFVEKRDGFTRPQLMNKVRVVHDTDFNREDSLRAFGKLLRGGKLLKSGGGRFVASNDIGYQPSERAAI